LTKDALATRAFPWLLAISNGVVIAATLLPWERGTPGPSAFGLIIVTRGFETWPGLLSIVAALAVAFASLVAARSGTASSAIRLLGGAVALQVVGLASIAIRILLGVGDPYSVGYVVQVRPGAWLASTASLVSIVGAVVMISSMRQARMPTGSISS